MMDLGTLMDGLAVRVAQGDAAVAILGITEDSRQVGPGDLFVARRGQKHDGRALVPSALAAGAVAVMCDDPELRLPSGSGAAMLVTGDIALASAHVAERFFGSPSRALVLCGVTGTNGKTTITYLVHQLARLAGVRCGMIGTVCVDDGVRSVPASLTTPPAIELSRVMGAMVANGCGACVMETSSHSLEQGRVAAMGYRAAVFTNLSHDHLDYHGTMENYAAAKARLFEMLPPEGVAIVNVDDPWTGRMVRDCRAGVVGCSGQSGTAAQVWAEVLGATTSSTRVRLRALAGGAADGAAEGRAGLAAVVLAAARRWDGAEVVLPLVGGHNVTNALQAALAAVAVGGDAALVLSGLATVKAPPGRLEPVTPLGGAVQAYVDYAHSDDSLRRVLAVLRGSIAPPGRLICVMGCGGDRDKAKRPAMGRVAAELSDVVVITSDNPRTEEPGAIIGQIVAGVPVQMAQKVCVEADRGEAISLAAELCREGDVLLVAGKGHEDYQIIAEASGVAGGPVRTVKVHFDDREVTRAALKRRGWVVS